MTRNMNVKLSLLAGISLAAASVSHGIAFTKVNGDFSKAEDWPDQTMATAANYVDFTQGTYYATLDASFRLIQFKNSNASLLLDLSANNPMISLNQQNGDDSILLIPGKNATVEFRGGVWRAVDAGTSTLNLRVGANYSTTTESWGHTVRLTSNAILTNLVNVFVAGASRCPSDAGNTLALESGSKLFANNLYIARMYLEGDYSRNTLRLSGGARATVDNFYTDERNNGLLLLTADGLWLEIAGGSALDVSSSGHARIGHYAPGATVVISNTASRMTFGQLEVGYAATSVSNRIFVSGGGQLSSPSFVYLGKDGGENRFSIEGVGSAATFSNLYLGNEATAPSNVLEVLDGATLSTAAVYLGVRGSYNTLLVSNATLNVTAVSGRKVMVGSRQGSRGNLLWLRGENANLSVTSSEEFDMFAESAEYATGGNEVRFSDGVSFTRDANIGLFKYAHDDTLRIAGNATFGHGAAGVGNNRLFTIGRWGACSSNNTLMVESGGKLDVAYLRVTCVNNKLVVSNATVTCHNSSGCTVGYYLSSSSYQSELVTNCQMVIQGDAPAVLSEAGPVSFGHNSRLHFDLPACGYATERAPISAKTLTMENGCLLTADAVSFQIRKKHRRVWKLVETENGVTIPANVLSAANAGLPEGFSFGISGDGKSLLLKVPVQPCFTVSFR